MLNEMSAIDLLNTFSLCKTDTLIKIMHSRLNRNVRKIAEIEYMKRIKKLNKRIEKARGEL